MAARKKNNTWVLRSKHGRDKIFSTPEMLIEAVGEYFVWVNKNPLYRNEAIKSGDHAGTIIPIPIQRPYTLKALAHFLDISFKTWQLYKQREEFEVIITKVEEFIYNQKFECATAGIFNSNIIARELGLIDRKDQTTDGESLNKGFYDFIKKANTKNDGEGA